MRVHKTGHEIADTVADAFIAGNYQGAADLVYGILRHNVFNNSKRWFNVDRGYFNPSHFDGFYRISYKGTQAKWHDDIPQQDIDFELDGWRNTEYLGTVLICPPSIHVCRFFGVDLNKWLENAKAQAREQSRFKDRCVLQISTKDNPAYLSSHLEGMITFNSSIGWQALQRGIPVYSDPNHSIIGSYYKAKLKNPIDFLSDAYKQVEREPLFKAMRSHQFTLKEISEGKAQCLIQHYLTKSF